MTSKGRLLQGAAETKNPIQRQYLDGHQRWAEIAPNLPTGAQQKARDFHTTERRNMFPPRDSEAGQSSSLPRRVLETKPQTKDRPAREAVVTPGGVTTRFMS